MNEAAVIDRKMNSSNPTSTYHNSNSQSTEQKHVGHKNQGFSFSARVQSFKWAFRGVGIMLKSQQNAWIHAVASVLVLITGAFFCLTAQQWCWLVLAIMAVWTAEALNTALELLADAATPEFHPLVEKAKDVAAGAVLISAMGSVVIGIIVLGPCMLKFIGSLL
jgi:diacylglycerol kinase (ATP)